MAHLTLGDRVPALDLLLDNDERITLTKHGKPVVLYFYPKDDTPGCTQEACGFRDAWEHLTPTVQVLGVSRDSQKSHQRFREKHQLPFPLVVDESGELCQAFGVWIEKSMYGKTYMGVERSTFLLDAQGVIVESWRKVKVPGHVDAVLSAVHLHFGGQ